MPNTIFFYYLFPGINGPGFTLQFEYTNPIVIYPRGLRDPPMPNDSCPIVRIPADDRITYLPVGRHALNDMYELAVRSMWTYAEISTKDDVEHYRGKLDAGRRHFVEFILAFFAASDTIVNVNLMTRFIKEVDIPEVQMFWRLQGAMEDIHSVTYSNLLDAIVSNVARRTELFNAFQTIPVISEMTKYMRNCIGSSECFAARILRMVCVEGIFFQGCFAGIYWLASTGLMPGLAASNELIARDEGLHTVFGIALFLLATEQISVEKIHEIINEAIEISAKFARAALPEPMPGMSAEIMVEYNKSRANDILVLLGHKPLYTVTATLSYANLLNLPTKVNFFEREVTDYAQAAEPDDGSVAVDF